MKQALGLVEIQGMSTAVVVADTMAKAANIQILGIENTKGLGYMTIKVAGDVGAVNAAVNAGRQIGTENQKLVSWKVIPRPSDYVEHTFCSPVPPDPGAPSVKEEPAQESGAGIEEKEKEAEVATESNVAEPVEREAAVEVAESEMTEEAAKAENVQAAAETTEAVAKEDPAEPEPAELETEREAASEPAEEVPAQPEEAAAKKKTTTSSRSSTTSKKGAGTRSKK